MTLTSITEYPITPYTSKEKCQKHSGGQCTNLVPFGCQILTPLHFRPTQPQKFTTSICTTPTEGTFFSQSSGQLDKIQPNMTKWGKIGQKEKNMVEWGQTGPNGVQWGIIGSNEAQHYLLFLISYSVFLGQRGLNGIKGGQMRPKRPNIIYHLLFHIRYPGPLSAIRYFPFPISYRLFLTPPISCSPYPFQYPLSHIRYLLSCISYP